MHDQFSNIQGDGQRHSGSSGGLGDLRLVGSAWVFKPVDHPNGNVNLGIGVKFPTGEYRRQTTIPWPMAKPPSPG